MKAGIVALILVILFTLLVWRLGKYDAAFRSNLKVGDYVRVSTDWSEYRGHIFAIDGNLITVVLEGGEHIVTDRIMIHRP